MTAILRWKSAGHCGGRMSYRATRSRSTGSMPNPYAVVDALKAPSPAMKRKKWRREIMNGRSVMPLLSDEKLQRNWDAFVQISSSAALTIAVGATSVVAFAAEQSELRRIACRLGKAEVAEGMGGQQPPARGALQITALDQKRLDDVLDSIARLRQCRGHRFHADRTAAVIHRDGG